MSTSLPSAQALMTHADDPRHIIYATWVKPKFHPYIRGLLEELTMQPAQENLARTLLDTVIVQPSDIGCQCLIYIEKLRAAFKAYGERGMSIASNRAWSPVSVTMIYFILVTDFYFAKPMCDQEKAIHLTELRMLEFAGPKLPTHFLP